MDGVAGISDYQTSQLLAERYERLQIVFGAKEKIGIDDVAKLHRMDEIGKTFDVSGTRYWIAKHWM